VDGAPSFIDCRDPQHYFLGWLKGYRLKGSEARAATHQDGYLRPYYLAQYNWLKQHWFNGVEFYNDTTRREGRLETLGLPCLPGLCP
jgi:hypothetical protein